MRFLNGRLGFCATVLILFMASPRNLYSQSPFFPTSTITGRVIDRVTQQALIGVKVIVLGTGYKGFTDDNGYFTIERVIPGVYHLRFSTRGFTTEFKSDVVAASGRSVFLQVELEEIKNPVRTIASPSSYFFFDPMAVSRVLQFDFEEVRRSAGALEDPERFLAGLPGIQPLIDSRIEAIVRGSSPVENVVYVDDFELALPEHFGLQGFSGGLLGMYNLNQVRGMRIRTGGFSARYGNRLSSVLELNMREGNINNVEGTLGINSNAVGAALGGPAGASANWLLSVRRSYLDLAGGPKREKPKPRYWDLLGKLHWNVDYRNTITLIALAGLDAIDYSRSDGEYLIPSLLIDRARNLQDQYLVGGRWVSNFGRKWRIDISASVTRGEYALTIQDSTGRKLREVNAFEKEVTVRGESYLQVSSRFFLRSGLEFKPVEFRNTLEWVGDTSGFGNPLSAINADVKENSLKFAIYSEGEFFPFSNLLLKAGLRIDHFAYLDEFTLSPRAGIRWRLWPNLTLIGSAARLFQNPPYPWLSSDPANKKLHSMYADVATGGVEYLVVPDWKFTAEVYAKEYRNYLVSVEEPTMMYNSLGLEGGFFYGGKAVNAGVGYARGIDVSIEKKLSSGYYGLLSYAFTKTRFKALAGGWAPGTFDHTHAVTLTGGVQLSRSWTLSARWQFATGRPYTPFDAKASIAARRGVFQRGKFMASRYPEYHRLDVRIDLRLNFHGWDIVAFAELRNLYNRKNVYSYVWDARENELREIDHLPFFPVFGFSTEF
ncbi:MAG: TonB-dependent receptor [Chlorobi bacterium]|nr:TonB-dependent receptor [Chlorobiota bacterium]